MSEPEKKSGSKIVLFLKVVVLLVLVGAALIMGVGLFVLDGKYDLSREVTIQASPEAVHKQVGDLREWPNWLPFTKHDKSVKTKIDTPTGAGAHQTWTGNGGTGELTFVSSDENKGIEYDMVFDGRYPAHGSMTYGKAGDATRVTWRMTGQNDGVVGKWLAFAMPKMVGPMFEEGLTDLKTKVEAK